MNEIDEFERLKALIQEAYEILLAADEENASQAIAPEFTEEDWIANEEEDSPESECSEPFMWSPDFFEQIDS